VPGGGRADRLGPRCRQHDQRAPAVRLALFPGDEPALLHARELMGQAALLPVQRLADLERPEPLLRFLAELHEHLVLGKGKPGIVLQLAV
jgi:hypothetical protein